ncbi:hypothetical protein PR048_025739 [Dryococelus australis]|uniref:Uncharacterized protein n=1 Tax=Dryococelus australis TaxID=614101 RepID=A0ABQ9GJE6_9NEOP|nr:hypothetical protein PR048_025739 [Dryococelus australis]
MEQRRNERTGGGGGDHRGNPLTSGIVRHYSQGCFMCGSPIPICENPGTIPLGIELGSPWREGSTLTTAPPCLPPAGDAFHYQVKRCGAVVTNWNRIRDDPGSTPASERKSGREKLEIPEKTHRLVASSGMTRTYGSDPAGNRTRRRGVIRTNRNSHSAVATATVSQNDSGCCKNGVNRHPRENPSSIGIVLHDSHLRKSGVTRPGIEPGAGRQEAGPSTHNEVEYHVAEQAAACMRSVEQKSRRHVPSLWVRIASETAASGSMWWLLACAVCVGVASAGENTYGEVPDTINLHAMMRNDRVVASYEKCLMDEGPCTKHGEALKRKVAERLACSPPTKANQVQSPVGPLPDFRTWKSCRTMPLVSGFSRWYPVSPAISFQRRSILTSITFIGSQDLAVKSRPDLFTHSVHSLTSLPHHHRLTASTFTGYF